MDILTRAEWLHIINGFHVVSSKLIELGLSKDRIVGIIGRGENNPAKSNETSEGRGSNRRVEFRFVKKGQV